MPKNTPKKKKPQNTPEMRGPEAGGENNDKSSPSGEPGNDNLDAAVGASLGDLTVVGASGSGAVAGGPADKGVLVRVTEGVREEWKLVAAGLGLSLSEFVRVTVQERVDGVLRCPHPLGLRKVYPWSEFCLRCGERLRA